MRRVCVVFTAANTRWVLPSSPKYPHHPDPQCMQPIMPWTTESVPAPRHHLGQTPGNAPIQPPNQGAAGRSAARRRQGVAAVHVSQPPPAAILGTRGLCPQYRQRLTAPIRNKTPGFPHVIVTENPDIRAYPKQIRRSPHLNQHLKTDRFHPSFQQPAPRSETNIEGDEKPAPDPNDNIKFDVNYELTPQKTRNQDSAKIEYKLQTSL